MTCMAMLLPLYGTMVIDGSDGYGHPGFPEHAGHHYSGHRVRDILHKETDKVYKGAQEVRKKQHGLSMLFSCSSPRQVLFKVLKGLFFITTQIDHVVERPEHRLVHCPVDLLSCPAADPESELVRHKFHVPYVIGK